MPSSDDGSPTFGPNVPEFLRELAKAQKRLLESFAGPDRIRDFTIEDVPDQPGVFNVTYTLYPRVLTKLSIIIAADEEAPSGTEAGVDGVGRQAERPSGEDA